MSESWYDKTLLAWSAAAEDDRVHWGDTSAPPSSRDRTMTRADARRALQCQVVSQTAHGFSALDPVRHDGSEWVKATADTDANARWLALVVAVPDADTFVLQVAGDVIDQSGLSAGSTYYLQDAGGIGSSPGSVEAPVLRATSTTAGRMYPVATPAPPERIYDLVIGFAETPDADALDWLLVARPGTIASADPGEAYARTNPSDGDWEFDLRKNGASFGAVTVATDGSITWSVASDVTLARGDRVEIVAPSTPDSTGADVQVTLRAVLT